MRHIDSMAYMVCFLCVQKINYWKKQLEKYNTAENRAKLQGFEEEMDEYNLQSFQG